MADQQENPTSLRHKHQVMPMISVPDDTEIITKKPKSENIPTRKEFIETPERFYYAPASGTVDFSQVMHLHTPETPLRECVPTPTGETLTAAIERLGRYHGDTYWKVNCYQRNDDGSKWMNFMRNTYLMTVEEQGTLNTHQLIIYDQSTKSGG
jgi:hypothetical protein